MKATILPVPMGLFPEPLNDSVILTNNGPGTIYLDSDSSVSDSSFPLIPTATIVWDAHRALWCVSPGGPSTLVYTRNSDSGNAGRALTSYELSNKKNVSIPGSGILPLVRLSDWFETSPYASIYMILEPSYSVFEPDRNNVIDVVVEWRNRGVVTAVLYNFGTPNRGRATLTFPVLGDECKVSMMAYGPLVLDGKQVVSAAIYGTNRKEVERVEWIYGDGLEPGDRTPVFGYAFGSTYQPWRREVQRYTDWNRATNIVLNSFARKVRVVLYISGPVTTAGFLVLRVWNGGQQLARVPVPVNTSSTVLEIDWILPIGFPCDIIGTTFVHTGLAELTIYPTES